MIELIFKVVNTEKERLICFDIRQKVFVEEQKVSVEIEQDNFDLDAFHFLVFHDTVPVATARLVLTENKLAKIGRVAVLKNYRGKGIGKFIMSKIITHAENLEISRLVLASQDYAVDFYQKCGFEIFSEKFMDANMPHYWMFLDLN